MNRIRSEIEIDKKINVTFFLMISEEEVLNLKLFGCSS